MATSVAKGSAATAEFDMDEVKKHDKEDDCWLVIGGKVYDVTAYLPEHPGGADIMLGSTGYDATDDFEDVGHSTSAREEMEKFCIGKYKGGKVEKVKQTASTQVKNKDQGSPIAWIFPLTIVVIALLYKYLFNWN